MTTFFLSPGGQGNGKSQNDPASFQRNSVWSDILDALDQDIVEVCFLDGIYESAIPLPAGTGHPSNQLVLQGQSVRGVIIKVPDDPFSQVDIACEDRSRQPSRLTVTDCQNITIKGFHFNGNGTIGYVVPIRGTSHHIAFVNCSFADMPGVYYAATGAGGRDVHHITYKSCSFSKVGCDGHAHFMYHANDSRNIFVHDCTFTDCAGDYVRFRNGVDKCVVSDCRFISNGSFPVNDPHSRPFIAIPLFNDCEPGSKNCPDPLKHQQYEYFGTDFVFANNSFRYKNHPGRGKRHAMTFYHQGFDPPGRNHLLTFEEGSTLVAGSKSIGRALLMENCGIDMRKVVVYDNNFSGVKDRFTFGSVSKYGSVSKGWGGFANIYQLTNRDDQPGSPRWLEPLIASFNM